MSIVVCGVTSSGKSTLVNALLGRCVMPTGVQETTGAPVFIDTAARFRERRVVFGSEEVRIKDDEALRASVARVFKEQTSTTPIRVTVRPVRSVPGWRLRPRFLRGRVLPAFLVDLPGVNGADDAARIEWVRRYACVDEHTIVCVLSAEDTERSKEEALLRALSGVAPRRLIVVLGRADALLRDHPDDLEREQQRAEDRVREHVGVHVAVLPLIQQAALAAEVLGPGRHIASSGDLERLGKQVVSGTRHVPEQRDVARDHRTWTSSERKRVTHALSRVSKIECLFRALTLRHSPSAGPKLPVSEP